jgi:hypothetical protein
VCSEQIFIITSFQYDLSVENNGAITTKRCICNTEKKIHHNHKHQQVSMSAAAAEEGVDV